MEKAVVSAGGDLPTAREIRRSKQNIRKILRRLLLVIMVVIIGLFFPMLMLLQEMNGRVLGMICKL